MNQEKVKYPNLVAEMARRGERQKVIAELLGVAVPTVCRKLSGQIGFSISEIEILCEHFGKDYYELFK